MKIKNVTYRIEVGRGPKGAYSLRYRKYSVKSALMWYSGINIGNGYKKRLVLEFDVIVEVPSTTYTTDFSPVREKVKEKKRIILDKQFSA